jgi:hypothetical protein
MRLPSLLPAFAWFFLLCSSGAQRTKAADGLPQAVIVELFTSEGCSSCPPADALLQKLDQAQPVPGALIIPLSEHVDYWDGLGWRDPFSSPVYTRRQEGYDHRFRLDSIYTPQVVIDGAAEAVGSDTRQIEAAIRRSVRPDKLHVEISPAFKSIQGVASVRVQVNRSEKSATRSDARLMVALAENAVVSHVLRGENSGRKLDYVAVVRTLIDLGRVDAAGAFSTDIPLTGELEQWRGKRIVAFVQDPQYGQIRGAASRLLSQ